MKECLYCGKPCVDNDCTDYHYNVEPLCPFCLETLEEKRLINSKLKAEIAKLKEEEELFRTQRRKLENSR